MGVKKAEFDADFKSIEKIGKKCLPKVCKICTFLPFSSVYKSSQPSNFLCVNCFASFYNYLRIQFCIHLWVRTFNFLKKVKIVVAYCTKYLNF